MSIGLSDIYTGVSTLENSLDYHLQRQVVLNSNLANADTPGYRPNDLGFLPPEVAGSLVMQRTDDQHIDPSGRPAMLVPFADPTQTPGNDQNAVDMDRELAKLSANALRYESAAELISRRLGLLKYAAGDGAGS